MFILFLYCQLNILNVSLNSCFLHYENSHICSNPGLQTYSNNLCLFSWLPNFQVDNKIYGVPYTTYDVERERLENYILYLTNSCLEENTIDYNIYVHIQVYVDIYKSTYLCIEKETWEEKEGKRERQRKTVRNLRNGCS